MDFAPGPARNPLLFEEIAVGASKAAPATIDSAGTPGAIDAVLVGIAGSVASPFGRGVGLGGARSP